MQTLRSGVALSTLFFAAMGFAGAQAAPVVFSGIDANGNANVALASTPNADAARNALFANLAGVGTETFETRSGSSPLAINFGAAGTATINGPGSVASVTPGTTNGFGRYSVPSATSSRFWEADAGTGGITVTFSAPVAAFGFYGIDIGDFSGTVVLRLTDTGGATSLLNVPAAASGRADGSVLYFGFYDTAVQYTSIAFLTTGGSGDVFAFDNFSIGSIEQVVPVPEPMSLALFGLGLAGLGVIRRKR
ncbi:MAG: PEP-CTERM sorting domain-containing protein [Proteobacteria bacterium]|nr:PEP-CTERM sorting domain-containing protein [Pseudomonadota bacterium]